MQVAAHCPLLLPLHPHSLRLRVHTCACVLLHKTGCTSQAPGLKKSNVTKTEQAGLCLHSEACCQSLPSPFYSYLQTSLSECEHMLTICVNTERLCRYIGRPWQQDSRTKTIKWENEILLLQIIHACRI